MSMHLHLRQNVIHSPWWIYVFVLFILSSCSNTRFLTGDQKLYTGNAAVQIEGKDSVQNLNQIKEKIQEITFFKPNNSLFGKRRILPPTGLWAYNYLKPKKEGKKGGWMYRNFKKKPILIETVNPDGRTKQLKSSLFGMGYFNSDATFKLIEKRNNSRKAKILYTVYLGKPFIFNKVLTTPPVDSVDIFINSYVENMNIKPGDVFDVDIIKEEKKKISSQIIEKGYYYFGTNYLEFDVDTTIAPYRIDMMISRDRNTPVSVLKKYTIGEIKVIFSDVINDTLTKTGVDTIYFDGIVIIGANDYLKSPVIRRCIPFISGDLYATSKHQVTIKQLNNYGVFKNVKVQFVPGDTLNYTLNLVIELETKENVSMNLEGFVQAKSTGFAGPGMEASLTHGNIGKSANKLQLKLTGGFEWQWGNETANDLGTNSYNVGMSSAFVFPRIILPFNLEANPNLLLSKTICDFGFEFLNNVRYYRMTSFNTAYSYQWKFKPKVTHIFSPLRVNIVNLLETTKEFDEIADSNIYVSKSFEEQTILGLTYSYIYDNTLLKQNGFYFQGTIGTSGNLANLINLALGNSRPYKILGNVYSQFLKTSVDVRYYTGSLKEGFVFRFYSGIGYSYGNSIVMPYIEQFYSGGSASIRAFPARSLGPGSYQSEDSNGIIDQTGDIKGEFNVEYRFPLSETVYLAAFTDVGNVWLLNEDEFRPGAEFLLNTFTDQLAIGSGLGLRFDFDFFILRGDFGFPVRYPYENDSQNWVKDFSESVSNFTFNIAIGYPF